MSMVEDGDSAIAAAIAGKLADAALEKAGAIAFGQMLSVVDWDPSGQEAIGGELQSVLSALNALAAAIKTLTDDLERAAARNDYDTIAQQANPLIAANATILAGLQDLAKADNDPDRAIIKAGIRAEMNKVNMAEAPAMWNTILCGSEGSTGLIVAWNRLVKNSYPIFGPDASQALQQHWEHADGQQALSISYSIELINSGPLSDEAKKIAVQSVHDTWRRNRKQQLALLRGMMAARYGDQPAYSDRMEWLVNGAKVVDLTPMHVLPYWTTIVTVNGGLRQCYLSLRGPIARGQDDLADFYNLVASYSNEAGYCGVGGYETYVNGAPGPHTWDLHPKDEMVDILNALGGHVGQSDADLFADALKAQGFFNLPDGQLRLWGDGPLLERVGPDPGGGRGMPNYTRDGKMWLGAVFVDGGSWWNPSTDPNDTAMLMLVREPTEAETVTYWYDN